MEAEWVSFLPKRDTVFGDGEDDHGKEWRIFLGYSYDTIEHPQNVQHLPADSINVMVERAVVLRH